MASVLKLGPPGYAEAHQVSVAMELVHTGNLSTLMKMVLPGVECHRSLTNQNLVLKHYFYQIHSLFTNCRTATFIISLLYHML